MAGAGRRLSPGQVAAYASLGFVTKALTLPLLSYLPPAFAQASGLALTTLGVVFMVARLWDIVLDPFAGYLIDRFDPPLGPRKFWLIAALPMMLVTIPPLFAPAAFGLRGEVGLSAMVVLLLVFYFGWTLLTVVQYAWPIDLAAAAALRTRLIGWREWAGVLGMLAIVSAPALMERGHGGTLQRQVMVMGGFALVALPLGVLWAVGVLPRIYRADRRLTTPAPSIFRLVRRSAQLRGVLLADLLSGAGFAVVSATSFFIFDARLGLGGRFSTLMFAFFVGMVAGVPLMTALSLRLGARRTFQLAMIAAALTVLSLYLVPHRALLPALAVQLLLGVWTGGYQVNLNSLMAEVTEADRRGAETDASGAHFALLALTNKLGYAFAIGMAYPALQACGFRQGHPLTVAGEAGLLAVGLGLTALLLGSAGVAVWLGVSDREGRSRLARRSSQRAPGSQLGGCGSAPRAFELGGQDGQGLGVAQSRPQEAGEA